MYDDEIGKREGFVRRTHVRCEDCDVRGDLDAVGRVVNWFRVRVCDGCGGHGELPLLGIDRLDPYAQRRAVAA